MANADMTTPEQPADAFLAACTALLMAIATNSTIDEHEVDTLLGAMPDVDLRDGLRVGLRELGLRADYFRMVLR